jgi:hypothetical protein
LRDSIFFSSTSQYVNELVTDSFSVMLVPLVKPMPPSSMMEESR